MALILNIETATQICSVGIALEGKIIALRESSEKNIHASKTTVFVEEALKEARTRLSDLDAVAVSMGPGSYTGLRIGTSVAKGFCYSLDIPLVAVSTLQSMALGALKEADDEKALYCPMIDARRMEVYAAVFDGKNNEIREIRAEIIDEDSYRDVLKDNTVYFFGDGAGKCRVMLSEHANARFPEGNFTSAAFLAELSYKAYLDKDFADKAYYEPFYLKEFVPGIPRVKGLR